VLADSHPGLAVRLEFPPALAAAAPQSVAA
jgi:hypothetical protein